MSSAEDESALDDLQRVLVRRYDVDLSSYDKDFLRRRIAFRLDHFGLKKLSDYLPIILRDAGEHERLVELLSIEVTRFFREKELFDAIADIVLPELARSKLGTTHPTLKAWSAGCATGEEAYSLAIIIEEFLSVTKAQMAYTITATDRNQQFLNTAKKALYSREKVARVPIEFLEKYFVKEGKLFKPAASLLPFVRFFRHDLSSKFLIPKNDLILCRNVLIYMAQNVREEMFSFFHDCLNPGGYLVLGGMEAIVKSDQFKTVDIKNCIYRRTA